MSMVELTCSTGTSKIHTAHLTAIEPCKKSKLRLLKGKYVLVDAVVLSLQRDWYVPRHGQHANAST